MEGFAWLEEYLLSKPGATKDYKLEWGWWRFQVRGKLFAALLHPSGEYQSIYAGKDLLTLKCDPQLAELYREQYPEVLPGFYTDKRHWNSVDLGGSLPEELVRQMVDDSYQLVVEKLPKYVQRQLRGED